MADFLKGVALGGKEGWNIGSAMATKKGDRKRKKKEELEALKLGLLRAGYKGSMSELDDLDAKELSMMHATQEAKNKQDAAETAANVRRTERDDLLTIQRYDRDEGRAWDAAQEVKKARTKVAGFDPKIREQVSQAPSLIRPNAPSLPVPEEFQGSKLEDITRSLKEEKGETDWLAAYARGAQLQSVENDIRKRGADFAHAMKVKGYEATANRFASAGGNPKIVFDEIVEKDSVVPVEHQRAYFDAGRNAYDSKVSLSDRAMFETTAPSVMKEANKYKRYMPAMPSPKTFSSLNQLGEWQSKIDDAKLRSEIADFQRKVKVAPSGVKKMEDGALMVLPEKNLLSIRQIWSEAFDAQKSASDIKLSAEKVGAETAARVAATPKLEPHPRLTWVTSKNDAGDLEVTVVPNKDSRELPTRQDYLDAEAHAKRLGYGWKEMDLTDFDTPFRNDAEIKAAISAGQLAVGDSYTYIDPRTGEEKIAILEEE